MILAMAMQDIQAWDRAVAESSPNETGVFFSLSGGNIAGNPRLVASDPYFPLPAEWDYAGPDQLRPGSQLLSKMISRAENKNLGLLFVHSHPKQSHPTDFSAIDKDALRRLSEVVPGIIPGPFAAAVAGPNGWAARVYRNGAWDTIETVTSAGRGLRILTPRTSEQNLVIDDRQLRALGDVNTVLRGLNVSVVGCGGLGSPLVETLVRMGVRQIVLVDGDNIDHLSNVRRIFGSSLRDVNASPRRPKVSIVKAHCDSLELGTEIIAAEGDIRDRQILNQVLNTDLVFSATDTHSSRATLNAIAYAYHVPVIDCGVRVGVRSGPALSNLVSEVRLISPGLPCLWCRNVISAEQIAEENLPDDVFEGRRREGYVVGSREPEPSLTGLTVMGAGMMACELLTVISDESEIMPEGYRLDAIFGDNGGYQSLNRRIKCVCRTAQGAGDDAQLGLIT